jgi:serine/threonine-protein kinase
MVNLTGDIFMAVTSDTQSMIPEEEVREALAPNYVLERELGRGGMGAVYLARDVRLDRPVAIKFLPPDMAAREDLRARFLQETRTAASFSHPNIVPVHAVEEKGRVLCFVMGYVEGETLTTRVARTGPLSPGDAIRLLQECAWALSYAHGRGVIHRDVKPDNILIDRGSGRALITDFGIARSQEPSGLTMVGEVIGTPQYMSPEQATGEAIDARSDLYSLGVVAFFALTGRLPFESSTAHGYLTAHITRPAPPIGTIRPDIPPALATAVDRLLMKDPAQRFQTGEELAEALDPLRSARREIPPAIRLFQVKSTQVLRNALLLVVLSPTLAQSVRGDADQLLLMLMVLAGAFTLMLQAFGGLRELAEQGFTHDDLRSGLLAIGEEQSEARAQLRASPEWVERRRRRWWFIGGGVLVSALLIGYSFYVRTPPRPQGGLRMPTSGLIAAAMGASLGVATLVYFMAANGSAARIDNRLRRLWIGAFGKRVFDIIARRAIRKRPSARLVSMELGPLTVVEALPRDLRRELSDISRVISSLVSAQSELVDREARLTESQSEATRGTSGAATDTLDRVVTELTEARLASSRKREEIAAALERMRLELIRLRSGVGTVAEVRAESERARALLG